MTDNTVEQRIKEMGYKIGFQEISVDGRWIRADVVLRWLNPIEHKNKQSSTTSTGAVQKALKSFADMFGELTEEKVQQGGVVFKYNKAEITVADLFNASIASSSSTGAGLRIEIDKKIALMVLQSKNHNSISFDAVIKILRDIRTKSLFNESGVSSEWIELKKGCEMPEYDEYVLWYNEAGNSFVDCLDKDGNTWLSGGWNEEMKMQMPKTTHWMPLPKPPKQ